MTDERGEPDDADTDSMNRWEGSEDLGGDRPTFPQGHGDRATMEDSAPAAGNVPATSGRRSASLTDTEPMVPLPIAIAVLVATAVVGVMVILMVM